MQAAIRLLIAICLGLIVGGLSLYVFTLESSIGHGLIYIALPLLLTAIAYLGSFGANITISATNCPINVKKSAIVALIPTIITIVISLLFVGLERFTNIFAYIFKKVGINFSFASNWDATSIFGFAFFLFWGATYGQLVSGSSAEIC